MDKKKKKKAGKPPKKSEKKKISKKSTAIIRLEQVEKEKAQLQAELKTLKDGNNFSIIDSPLSSKQLAQVLNHTPKQFIHERPAKGGGKWKYVTGNYMKKVLNYTFGWLWDSEVLEHGIIKSAEGNPKQIWVMIKLSIKRMNPKSKDIETVISKTQIGGSDIAYKKSTFEMLDYANDFKAAITDGVKKCAAELGFASDVYGGNEFKKAVQQEQGEKKDDPKPAPKSATDETIDYMIAGLNTYGWTRDNTNRVIEKNIGAGKVLEKLKIEEKVQLIKLLDDTLKKFKKGVKK